MKEYRKIVAENINKLEYKQVEPKNCWYQFEKEDGEMKFILKIHLMGDAEFLVSEFGEEETPERIDYQLMGAIFEDFKNFDWAKGAKQ